MRSLKETPGNSKFDLFHQVKMALKYRKSTDGDQNKISSESGQDMPPCKIGGKSKRLQWKFGWWINLNFDTATNTKCKGTIEAGRVYGTVDILSHPGC